MNNYVEIICVGNELLIGKTLNTNSQWLGKRITTLGLTTHRITVVGDDVNEISCAIIEAIRRKSRFIISTGGLGPTFDDKTLEGIAKALKRKILLNQEALKMIKDKYFEYSQDGKKEPVELTPHRIKMAMLPQGSKPIPNSVGTAPAVIIEHNNLIIIALPGVPSEMKSIFEKSVTSLLKPFSEGTSFFEISINSTRVMESEIAPIIDKVMKSVPSVYIKSHPKGTESSPQIELHLSTYGKDADKAKDHLNKAVQQLTKLIKENLKKSDLQNQKID
jgi:molybdenum cofactor synthesis domain-containing protein